LQPLGGKTRKGRGKTGGFWRRNPRKGGERRSGVLLSLSDRWQGKSQKPGARRLRGWFLPGVPTSWRAAVTCFLGTAAIYGLAEGGYFTRSVKVASKKVSTLVVRAGFAVSRVTIEGQDRTPDADVVRALGLDQETSTLAFDTAAAQKRLEKLPLVRRAQVMRLLPSQLHVVLEERVPYAVWQHNGKLQLIDHDGAIIETINRRERFGLPLVVGEGAASNARELLDELALWPDVKSKVQAAVRVANRRWNLKLASGLEIRLPENGTSQALSKVSELDKTHQILSGDAASVDLRLADRITIRLNDDAAARRDSAFAVPVRKRMGPEQDT
jgi:cell division protein FtsQ